MVVCWELGQGKPPGPVTISVVDITAEVPFDDQIEPFHLSFDMGMIPR